MRAGIELGSLAFLASLASLSGSALWPPALAAEPPRYEATTIPMDGEAGGYQVAEASGDSLLDLVEARWSRERGREILIYLQRPSGAYPLEPDRRVQVKKDVVAFAFADVREEPGSELIFFTASSAFSFSTASGDHAGNVRRLFQERFLWDVPGPRDLAFFPGAMDAQAAGFPEFLVPTREGFALFGKAPGAKEFERRDSFPAAVKGRQDPEAQRRRSFSFGGPPPRFGRPSSGLVLEDIESRAGGGDFLRVERWLPAPHRADANGDGRQDVLLLEGSEKERVLMLYLRDPDGSFPPEPSWRGKVPGKGPLWPVDLDEDRQVDLLSVEQSTAGGATFSFYRNRGGSFDLASPDQILKFSGYAAGQTVADLDGDGQRELAVSTYEIPGPAAVASGSVERRLLIHRREPGRIFTRWPVSTFEERFGPDAIRGIGQQLVLDGDLLGRGARDVLLVARDGALEARQFDAELRIAEEAFFRFVPPKVIVGVSVHALNGDSRSDIILRHSRSLTVLVSRK